MYLRIRVTANAKKAEIIDLGNGNFRVKVVSPPAAGRANRELMEILARHYKTNKSSITIKKGSKSREKLIEIKDL
ncbi:MAG: DUF167 domain-containing protein [candidate division WOR-3 bacterium]|nr:MAG: DUF167 domain-containing protein [candidate division WOR-3 bacterium]